MVINLWSEAWQYFLRRVWRYQRGNQNPYIKEEQTTQWPKDTKGVIRIRISKKNRRHNGHRKIQKDKQRFTKQTHKTKDRVTRTPLKTGVELRCSGMVSSSCSTSGTRHANLSHMYLSFPPFSSFLFFLFLISKTFVHTCHLVEQELLTLPEHLKIRYDHLYMGRRANSGGWG